MAYNLQPLITILEQILNPQQTQWIVDHNKPQLQSLLEKADSLQQILEKSTLTKIESLESQIREAVHKAEDMIESHMVDQMLSNPEAVSLTFSVPDLQQVIQELDSAMEQVVKLNQEKTMSSGSSSSGAAFSPNMSSKSVVVGVDEDLRRLKDRVMEMQSKLEVVPIVGMGGIGKTTLAQKLYQDPYIVEHFTSLAWTTVSQDYDIRAVLLSLLRCINGKESNHGIGDLKDELYQSLYGRRYLIVLDDIWSTTFWDEIRMYLPDNNEGSRILITTRESDVAKHANSHGVQHQMQLLSASASWDLLGQIVLGEEGCPDFLQGIGEKIARDCGGLPLAINVIGGLLLKVQRSREVWENIANNVAAAIAEADQQFSNILSLSYDHLPNHLKPCFLYMGAFPEDHEIKGSKLVHLWVAEGFVKSNGSKNLEKVAEDWLKVLTERNLVLVRRYKYGKPTIYGMHDLLRDLCIRKSNEDQFVYVKNGLEAASSNPRRVCVHKSNRLLKYDHDSAESMSLARSFILFGWRFNELPSGTLSPLRLLRVLDFMYMYLNDFPEEIFELANLRFLALYSFLYPTRRLLRLRNLKTLILKSFLAYLPPEIFQMSELRHLIFLEICIDQEEDMKKIVPNKLLTISMIKLTDRLIRSGFLESIPDIEYLGIRFPEQEEITPTALDLAHLHKLETLRIYSCSRNKEAQRCLCKSRFPCNLRKLCLVSVVIVPSVMMALSAVIPNLEVLKIKVCQFERKGETCDEEWKVAEGVEFRSLQFLKLESLDVVHWRADETNFPRLRHLIIYDCDRLEEIPSAIGDIPTLQLIELIDCCDSVEASARHIVEEQQSDYGNYDLKLHITSTWLHT